MSVDREDAIRAFEQDAERLVVYQTDVMAQIENQLRAARHTIRLVQKLRGAPHRVGPAPTDAQRQDTLDSLSNDWAELDAQLTTQHECCLQIQHTIAHMREGLRGLRKHIGSIRPPAARRDRSDPNAG